MKSIKTILITSTSALLFTQNIYADDVQKNTKVTQALYDQANALIQSDQQWLQKTFIDLHKNPELGFMETRTSNIVIKELKSLGFDVKSGIAKTGVVAILKNGEGSTVMYRADMDANAVEEKTGLDYASKVRVKLPDGRETPVAHMCGHDAHVAWLLGMARTMVKMKNEWRGTLVLIAQPAEEMLTGAQAMIDDGMWQKHNIPKSDYFFGMHTAPLPVGSVVSTPGNLASGSDQIDVLFKGKGGHGSKPQLTKNPILMATNAVNQFYAVPAQLIDPQQTAILTVGSIQAGQSNNIIPSEANVKVNLRWYDSKTRNEMIESIRSISNSMAKAYGMSENELPEITMKGSTTPLINDKGITNRFNAPLKKYLGDKNVMTDFIGTTGSEDVHILKGPYKDVEFTYLAVGVTDPVVYAKAKNEGKFFAYAPHSPNYVVDLKSIPVGTKISTILMLELLAK